MSKKVLNKNVIVGIVTLIIIFAGIAILSLTGGGPGFGGGGGGGQQQENPDLAIDDAGFVGTNVIRLTLRNTGNVDLKLKKIAIKGDNLEGEGIATSTVKTGSTTQVDVSITKGEPQTGANQLKFTIETDKKTFELEYSVNYNP